MSWSAARWFVEGVWPVVFIVWPFLLATAAVLVTSRRGREIASRGRLWVRSMVRRRRVLVGLASASVLVLLFVVVVVMPPLFADQHAFREASDAVRAQNEVRATLLQGLGGAVLLLGLYFTWNQLKIGREGQITERFTRAIDQIGSDKLDVRLGGIYALERIASDSTADRPTIGEVFTAYVRGHAPWPPYRDGQPAEDVPLEEIPLLPEWAPDVQAVLRVLDRGEFADDDSLEFSGADLRNAYLAGAHFKWAFFHNAHLERMFFPDADLMNASFDGADLRRANLEGADLTKASFEDADLQEARMSGAILTAAILREADLRGANLTGAKLDETDLEGAVADDETKWPNGFSRRSAEASGVVFLVSSGADASAGRDDQVGNDLP